MPGLAVAGFAVIAVFFGFGLTHGPRKLPSALPGQAAPDLSAGLIAVAEEVDREVRPWGGGVVAEPQGGVPARPAL